LFELIGFRAGRASCTSAPLRAESDDKSQNPNPKSQTPKPSGPITDHQFVPLSALNVCHVPASGCCSTPGFVRGGSRARRKENSDTNSTQQLKPTDHPLTPGQLKALKGDRL